jgi:hypothetical protein
MVDNTAHIDTTFYTPNDTQNDFLKYDTRYAEQPVYICIYIHIYLFNSKYRICRFYSYLVQGMGPTTL